MIDDRPIHCATEMQSKESSFFSDISFMAIFAEVTEKRIIDRHMRDIHPLLDYDASESQSMISI